MLVNVSFDQFAGSPVVCMEVRINRRVKKFLRIVPRQSKYNELYKNLTIVEGGSEDIPEEWEKWKDGNNHYKFMVILDAVGCTTLNEVIEKFEIIGVQGSPKEYNYDTQINIKRVPRFLMYYCEDLGFLEYD